MLLVNKYSRTVILTVITLTALWFLIKYSKIPICLTDFDIAPLNRHVETIQTLDRNMSLIFLGGVPRSGMKLMGTLLDAHSEVRCGQETRVLPKLLSLHRDWLGSRIESIRLQEAGVSKPILDNALAQLFLQIITKRDVPVPRPCLMDPFTLKAGSYVLELFPQAKFIFMIRDGRAVVNSIYSSDEEGTDFRIKSIRDGMKKWHRNIKSLFNQCQSIGTTRCLMVHYELLVLHPEVWLRKILSFLGASWDATILQHVKFDKENNIALARVESSDQYPRLNASNSFKVFNSWGGKFPMDVIRDMAGLAPMLSVLGYDPYWYPLD